MVSKWLILFIAGLFEVFWAICLKYFYLCNSNIKIYIFSLSIVSAIIAFLLLALSIKNIPVSIAYSVWTGIGIIGVTIFDILYFNEPAEIIKIFMIALILIGIIGLKLIE